MNLDHILESAYKTDPLPDLFLIADNDASIARIKSPIKRASATIAAYRKLFPNNKINKSTLDKLIVSMQ